MDFEFMEDLLVGDESVDADGFGDMGVVSAQDGCNVEPDGTCPHGFMSPLLRLGLI